MENAKEVEEVVAVVVAVVAAAAEVEAAVLVVVEEDHHQAFGVGDLPAIQQMRQEVFKMVNLEVFSHWL